MLKQQSLSGILASVLAVVFLAAESAQAASASRVNEAPANRMVALNKRAFADIQSQHFQAAKYWLEEALVISETAGLENDEITARTYVHLAVVSLAGLGDRDEALRYFGLALKINPNIAITRGLEWPGLRSAYLQAREEAGLPPNPDPTAPNFDTFAADASAEADAGKNPSAAAEPESPSLGDDRERPAASVREAYAAALVGEPDPPARVPAPLYCLLPFDAPPGQDLVARCLTQKHTHRSSAVFHYRAGGEHAPFADLSMDRSPKGWLVAVVPGRFIAGKSLAYYVTADLPSGQHPIHLGYPEAPQSLIVRSEASAGVSEDAGAAASHVGQTDAGGSGPREPHRRAVGSIWFSIAGGSGVVYHGRETVDSNAKLQGTGAPVQVDEGFSPATLFQLEPEIGYQVSQRLSVSLMARYQYTPKDSEGPASAEDEKVLTSAFALYLQARLAFLTVGNLQAYASGGAGFGRSFLAAIDKDCEAASCPLDHSDTVHGGDAGLLAGVGAIYHLGRNLGVFAEVKEIATLPKFMALTELSLGVAVAMSLGRHSAGPAGADSNDGS